VRRNLTLQAGKKWWQFAQTNSHKLR